MTTHNYKLDEEREAVEIFRQWVDSTVWHPDEILKRVLKDEVGTKTFNAWLNRERISAKPREAAGDRVVLLVRWLLSEHAVRPFMKVSELQRFIELYSYLPAINILQLRKCLHDLELLETGANGSHLFAAVNWQDQFAQWTLFSDVFDELWCIRASSKHGRVLSHATQDDAKHWYWWHRMSFNVGRTTKFAPNSPQTSLRGVYAPDYYRYQMVRFRQRVEAYLAKGGDSEKRAEALLSLLKSTKGFEERWVQSETDANDMQQLGSVQIPVPFFRQDGTLIWLVEVSAVIPNTPGYSLYTWLATDAITTEYLAQLRREADKPENSHDGAIFIEQFAHHFTKEQRFALGVG